MHLTIFTRQRAWLILLLVVAGTTLVAQSTPDEPLEKSKYKDPQTLFWLNTYGNIRITDRLFWIAQTHFRRVESGNLKFAGQWAQIYNRHAISYLFSSHFNASLGGVMRFNFNQDDVLEDEERVVPEWRIWHELSVGATLLPRQGVPPYPHRAPLERVASKRPTIGYSVTAGGTWSA